MQKNKKYLLTMLTFAFVIACTFCFQQDAKAAEKTGTVTFSIERFTIGQGYLIEPCQVDIYDTDNIASVREKLQILGKLLYRCQVYAAACSSLKLCAEFLTRSNAYNGAVAHVVFRTYKLF